MSASLTIPELNRELARKINEEALDIPQSPFTGKFVGILRGQVVVVADDLDQLVERLLQVEADPRQSLCLEVGLDDRQVQEIWGSR